MEHGCCHVPQLEKQSQPEKISQIEVAFLSIEGLNCPNCANRVRNALLTTGGVTSALVEHPDGLAEVHFNPTLVSTTVLIEAVRLAGRDGHHRYDAKVLL